MLKYGQQITNMQRIEDIDSCAAALKGNLNLKILSNRIALVQRSSIRIAGRANWPAIKQALSEWQKKGYLKILKDPEFALDDEVCVEFLTFFEHKSPIPGFLNWEE